MRFSQILVGRLRRQAYTLTVPLIGTTKVGATAGWVITGTDNISQATLPASQTGSTLVVGLERVDPGDVIRHIWLVGSVTSGGGVVSLSLALRRVRGTTSGVSDVAVASRTMANITSNVVLDIGNAGLQVLGAGGSGGEVVQADSGYYLLITGTTAAGTGVNLVTVAMNIDKA